MAEDETDDALAEGSELDPVDVARRAIHDLFDQGYIDENHATTALLAIDLGRHRLGRGGGPRRDLADAARDHDRGP